MRKPCRLNFQFARELLWPHLRQANAPSRRHHPGIVADHGQFRPRELPSDAKWARRDATLHRVECPLFIAQSGKDHGLIERIRFTSGRTAIGMAASLCSIHHEPSPAAASAKVGGVFRRFGIIVEKLDPKIDQSQIVDGKSLHSALLPERLHSLSIRRRERKFQVVIRTVLKSGEHRFCLASSQVGQHMRQERRQGSGQQLDLADRLDPDVWSSLISQIDNMHLLGSGAGDFSRTVLPEQFRKLLDFAVRQYSVVAVDLPGSMEDYECEVLLRAKRILMVSTPDIGALHVARRKAQWFRDLQLTDKVSVVMNWVAGQSSLSVQDLERIIQLPVRYQLPSGSKDVSKAVQD